MNKITLKILLFFFMVLPAISIAQNVTGLVIDGTTNEPLLSVNVLEKGTGNGTVTNIDGKFSLTVSSFPAVLEFSSLGYETIERTVDSAEDITVKLQESTATLDEVIITGLASSTKRENAANAVSVISSEELMGITVQSGLDGAMYGKFNGAEIKANSGAPGGGVSFRLRGVTSIFGNQQPLFIVDGIYVDNSTIGLGNDVISLAAGGGNASSNQDDASNRIADLEPLDIESVEILKGASAAAIYGSRAGGGVVVIKTKKGRGGFKVNFSQNVGFRSPTQLLGIRDYTAEQITALGGPSDATLTDYEAELYDHVRVSYTTNVSFSEGKENTNYFFSVTNRDEPGLVDNTGYKKTSARFNFGHKFNDWLDIDLTTNYITSTSDRGFFNNGNANRTVGYALAFTYPWENLFPSEGAYPQGGAGSNVLETVALTTNREEVNRILGSFRANANLYKSTNQNLKVVLEGGYDQYTYRTTTIFPRSLSFYTGDPLGGASISGSTVNTNFNLSAFLVHNYYMDNGLKFTTQLGNFFQKFDLNQVVTIAQGLNGSQTNLGQSSAVSTNQFIRPAEDKGIFIQEEINYDDKIIATIGLRGDKSTNNGEFNKMYYYPKANIAFNLHKFDFWKLDEIDYLKPRIAYGETGGFPNFGDRFTLMNPQFIGNSSGLNPSTFAGDPNIQPERQTELEYGLDFGFLNRRLNFEVSFYNKKVKDLLLIAQNPASSGFTSRAVNGGELQNKGIEIALNAGIIRKDDFNWSASFKWWRNRSEVTSLDIPPFTTGGFAASLGQFYIQEGKPATQIVGTYNPADFTPEEIEARDPEGDGFFVYGDAEPDFQMSWYNEISYKNFDFTFLWHWKQGGDNINLSTLLYDLAGTTWDYNDTGLDPSGQLNNGDYRASQAFVNPDPYIEDASYVRLREIGLFYNFTDGLTKYTSRARVGISARNLINIFDYNSYDPEVSNFGNNVLANNVEVTPYPASKFINLHLDITF